MREVPAGRTILAVIPDLLVASRIEEAAKRVGVIVVTAGSPGEVASRLDSVHPDLIIVDMAMPGLEAVAIAAAGRELGVPVVAFYPHVDVTLRRSARRAGIQHVYARSRFLRETAGILGEMLEAARK